MYAPNNNIRNVIGNNGRIELKIKLHHAVIDAWNPYDEFLKTLSPEDVLEIAKRTMMVDHKYDDPLDNRFESLQYSDPWKNSNHRKLWK